MYYPVSENKALISFTVTAKLICVFVFAYAFNVDFLMTWLISMRGFNNMLSRVEHEKRFYNIGVRPPQWLIVVVIF